MKKTQLIRLALWAAGGAAAVWLGVRFLLPLLLPFVVGLAAARLTLGPVRFLRRRGRLPDWLSSALVILGLYALLGLGFYWLCRMGCGELARFTQELPLLLQSMEEPTKRLHDWLDGLTSCAPALLQRTLRESVDGFFSSGRLLAEKGYAWLFSFASGAIAGLPDLMLFLVAMIASSVMFSSQYDTLRELARKKLPRAFLDKCEMISAGLKGTFSAWLKAELKLLGVIFLLLTAGLMLLGVGYPLLFGALIALVDALPVFGSGIVLLPWGGLCFLRGESGLGTGLLLLYAAAYLTRTTLEPRMVGRQVGMNPLLTLMALYAGYRLLGVPGMLLFPAGAMLVKQLWDHAGPESWRKSRD